MAKQMNILPGLHLTLLFFRGGFVVVEQQCFFWLVPEMLVA